MTEIIAESMEANRIEQIFRAQRHEYYATLRSVVISQPREGISTGAFKYNVKGKLESRPGKNHDVETKVHDFIQSCRFQEGQSEERFYNIKEIIRDPNLTFRDLRT